MGLGGQRHAPAALPPGSTAGTHCAGGWVGLQGRSGWVRKISASPVFDPRTVQPVAVTTHSLAIYRCQKVLKLKSNMPFLI